MVAIELYVKQRRAEVHVMPTVNYIWDGQNVLQETDEVGTVQASYTYEPEQYGNLVSQRRGGQTSYYHYDGLGSTHQLTDATETVTDTNMYDAWGVNRESTGTTEYPYRWVGEKGYSTDKELGSVYVRARVYQPKDARWRSRDPLGFVDGMNVYTYASASPAQSIDPSGLRDAVKVTYKCLHKGIVVARTTIICVSFFGIRVARACHLPLLAAHSPACTGCSAFLSNRIAYDPVFELH